eukprot:5781905-Amphidinium_carterae.1
MTEKLWNRRINEGRSSLGTQGMGQPHGPLMAESRTLSTCHLSPGWPTRRDTGRGGLADLQLMKRKQEKSNSEGKLVEHI